MSERIVVVDRDSVSAGDDIDPHRTEVRLPEGATVEEALRAVLEPPFHLARVKEGHTSWAVEVDGSFVASLEGAVIRFAVDPDEPFRGREVFFRYRP
ncbi:hypothetical protein [Salininema proteolyticum]|uniref:Uncharacterized protein n=1 Tax=Salininema proteolyticum TaxID=1607685 RepID=A0ABV8TUK7_9ACTN